MKTKKFNQKLRLNKKTVADLNGTEMNGIHGGKPESWLTGCASCLITGCCPTGTCPTGTCLNSACSGTCC